MKDNQSSHSLPQFAVDYIDALVKKVKYRKKIRQEVREELTDHFLQAISDCTNDEEKEQAIHEIIEEFGDVKMLAALIRRGKKRCRPLWRTIVVRAFQVAGLLLLLIGLRIGYLSVGKTVISVDYVAKLNEQMKQGRDESLNARPYYEKAVELSKIEVPESIKDVVSGDGEITEENVELVREYVKEIEPALEALRAGSEKPYYWARYTSSVQSNTENHIIPSMFEFKIHHLGKIKNLVKKIRFGVIELKRYQGDIAGAIDESIILIKFGDHLVKSNILLEQLVGISIQAKGNESLLHVLSSEELSTSGLIKCQGLLESIVIDNDGMNIIGERYFILDYIQRSFTDDGHGNGRVLIKGIPLVIGDTRSLVSGFVLGNYPDRREVTFQVNSIYDRVDKFIVTAPYELSEEQMESEISNILDKSSFLLRILFPSFSKVRSVSWRAITQNRATIMICSILRYQKENGEYPADLNVLVYSGYLKELYKDPFSGDDFVYKINDGDFVLYSLGDDMDDDGGVLPVDSDGKKHLWGGDDGDAVFWPVLGD